MRGLLHSHDASEHISLNVCSHLNGTKHWGLDTKEHFIPFMCHRTAEVCKVQEEHWAFTWKSINCENECLCVYLCMGFQALRDCGPDASCALISVSPSTPHGCQHLIQMGSWGLFIDWEKRGTGRLINLTWRLLFSVLGKKKELSKFSFLSCFYVKEREKKNLLKII